MERKPVPKLVTVFGGSGFIGRHLVRTLAKRGYLVRVAVRRPDLAGFLQPLGNVGQIQAVQANLRYRWSVDRAVQGASHVINLVGLLYETGGQRFNSVQDFGARAIAEASRAVGARLTHVSAIGADPESESLYARSKAAGEAAVRETLPGSVICRPSIVFGPEDDFFNKFASIARFSPFLPLIGGGTTQFQPVYVVDVAEALARSVDGQVEGGKVYELGGPEILTFRQCMEKVLEVTHRRRLLVSIPWNVARLQGSILGMLPKPLLTRDQVTLLEIDNVVSEKAIAEKRTLAGIGITPHSVDPILPQYLWRYRATGQYVRQDA
jgi:uncharacterized protein YbjT (DUF2867 family)